MKKKILLVIIGLLLIVGCDNLMNTPTKRVEEFLNKYQTNNSEVLTQLDYVLDNDYELTDAQKESYKDVMKRQYKDLVYTIKDEVVDGKTATVKVEIEVYDYHKKMTDADNYLLANQQEFINDDGTVDKEKFMTYKIEAMTDSSDKVKYTIDFTLTKVDDVWTMNDVTEIDRQKIHGIYSY